MFQVFLVDSLVILLLPLRTLSVTSLQRSDSPRFDVLMPATVCVMGGKSETRPDRRFIFGGVLGL